MKPSVLMLLNLFLLFLLTITFAQSAQSNRLIVTMSEPEVSQLNIDRELLASNRVEYNVTSESSAENILTMLSEKLQTKGWSNTWQQARSDNGDWLIAHFYGRGGANIRIEINQVSSSNHQLILYRY